MSFRSLTAVLFLAIFFKKSGFGCYNFILNLVIYFVLVCKFQDHYFNLNVLFKKTINISSPKQLTIYSYLLHTLIRSLDYFKDLMSLKMIPR